jgi:hypothetical protein
LRRGFLWSPQRGICREACRPAQQGGVFSVLYGHYVFQIYSHRYLYASCDNSYSHLQSVIGAYYTPGENCCYAWIRQLHCFCPRHTFTHDLAQIRKYLRVISASFLLCYQLFTASCLLSVVDRGWMPPQVPRRHSLACQSGHRIAVSFSQWLLTQHYHLYHGNYGASTQTCTKLIF